MNTYRVMIVYEVHADCVADALRKVVKFQNDPLYWASQQQVLLHPEIVQTDTAVLMISNDATPLERKNHGIDGNKH